MGQRDPHAPFGSTTHDLRALDGDGVDVDAPPLPSRRGRPVSDPELELEKLTDTAPGHHPAEDEHISRGVR